MKKLMILGALLAGSAMLGDAKPARADHCPGFGRGYGYGYSYGSPYGSGYYGGSYVSPYSYGYGGYGGFVGRRYGFYPRYSRGFSLYFGRGGFGFYRDYGHHHHHHGGRHHH